MEYPIIAFECIIIYPGNQRRYRYRPRRAVSYTAYRWGV
jgi:hypothetical protein